MPQEKTWPTVRANGLTFTYHELGGDGPLALCLHGFPDTPHTWLDDVAPALAAAGYRVVAPYMRGYAPTEIPEDGDFGALALGADVEALIEALGADEAVVVGHDWGGYAGYIAAMRTPERLRAFVTIDIPHPAAMRPSLGLAWAMRHFVAFQFRGASIRSMMRDDCAGVEKLWRRWSPNWSFDDEELAPIRRCFSDRESTGAATEYYRSFMGDQRGETARTLRSMMREPIEIPTLSVCGDSGPTSPEDFERAARYHDGAYERLVVPGAGHFVHREAPDRVVDTMLDFLDEHAPT
jgi:pimeloyl-ACP methyl ester carboxylesterase